MNRAGKSHPVEVLADWIAPIVLASAAAWAATAAGLPLTARVAGSVMALLGGIIAMRMAGTAPSRREAGFAPVEFEPQGSDDELLLDDPLVEAPPESRVVKLFAPDDPTPGELVLRISDYLSEQGKTPALAAQPAEQDPIDASASLHAALANIRATLR